MKIKHVLVSAVALGLVAGSTIAAPASLVEAASTKTVLAVGSTALQPLAAQAGEMYTSEHPGVTVTVQGGGSGAGLSQVGKGGVTIGNSDIFAERKDGVDASKLKDHKVGVVGFAPVVNKDVSIKNLSMEQLRDIFTGKITNWKEVGGKDEEIVIINRAAGSGTRATFEASVLKGETAKTSQEQDDSGAVQKIVAQTPGAISYLGFSYTKGTNAKGLKTVSVDKVKPTAKNVTTNKWVIWSYEHMYTLKKTDATTKAFIKFMTTKAVQKVAKDKLGYVPLADMKVTKDADGNVTKK
jgi:phosphate transport system substrate-binding protein